MKVQYIMAASFLILTLSFGTTSCGEKKKIGGCELDTIRLGIGVETGNAPPGSAWIRIHSLEFAGEELYRRAALELTSLLDTLGVTIYSRSELIHVAKGPCWPPYTIKFMIKGKGQAGGDYDSLRSSLVDTTLAGHHPQKVRPKDYGLFFVSCGKADRDFWTLWYAGE